MSEIILSIYELLGPAVQPNVDEREIQKHIDEIFEVCNKKNLSNIVFLFSSVLIQCIMVK